MKILCVIDSLEQGGAQRQLIGLATGMKENGNQVVFLTYHNFSFFNHILEQNGISVTCIEEPNYLLRLYKMRTFIRNGGFDGVISFLEAANFICEISGFPFRRWRLIVGERSSNPKIFKSVKLKGYRWFHLFSDFVVANSNANLEIVKKINPLISPLKCKVIYNTIDLKLWKPLPDYIPRKEGKLKIIVAANVQPHKNLSGLINALRLLSADERDGFIIQWYGSDPENPPLPEMQQIETYALGNILQLLPASTEMVRITQQADIIALFSLYEGFPNTICEGMACGKTVICSAVSDVPLLLSQNQNLLFDPTDPKSILNTIRDVIQLKDKEIIEIGNTNRIIAEKYFNKDHIVSQYLNLLSKS